ncbi:MFS transporter [Novosphingobium resinovorum]|uniref:MFS transporter n=1 Tax=Novosphingobium resinovorum TaxID=158500 RepID=UPI002ED034E8
MKNDATIDAFEAASASLPPAVMVASNAPLWKLIPLWLIVALIVSSPAIGAAVINAHMAAALHMNRTLLGAGFGLFVATAGVSGPFIARGFPFLGIRNVMLAGTTLAAVGAVLMITFVSSGPTFIICYGLVIGLGVGAAGILPVQTVVAAWFRGRRALAISVVMSAGEVAGVIAPPIFAWLITATGTWRSGWWVALGCFVIAGALISWVIPSNLATDPHNLEMGPPPRDLLGKASRVYKTSQSWHFGDAVQTRQFAFILLAGVIANVDWVFFLGHGVQHLRDIGYDSTTAALAVSIVVAASICGNALAGLLGDRIPPHWLAAGALLMISAGLGLATAPSGFPALVIFAVVFGFGFGATQVCWITLLTNYFGTKPFPTLLGIVFAVGTVAGALGSVTAGFVYDQLHTYAPVFIFTVLSTGGVALLQLRASPNLDWR